MMKPWLLVATCLSVLVLVQSARADAPPSFRSDVMAVLSKAGCNAGTCHGNLNGKGGFKLSLRGQDPDLDFAALTRDQLGRRVDTLHPDQSLILQKVTGRLPHEGGTRFLPGSPEYQVLRGWMERGLANDEATAPRLVKLAVTPSEQVVRGSAATTRLRVVGHFADGKSRDVTRMATYESSNPKVAVDVEGTARRAEGVEDDVVETALMVRYLEKQQVARLAFLENASTSHVALPVPRNYVDQHVFARLQALGIESSQTCPDHVFIRRVYLDLLGMLPTADEARSFLNDTAPNKRDRLIESVLARPELADFWALKWADLLRSEEKTVDPKGVRAFQAWLRQGLLQDRPLNNMARDVLAAQGSSYDHPEANFYRAIRDPQSRAEAVGQVFLGVRLQCAKCHNHPFDQWTQDSYYGLTAFFARIRYHVVDNNRKDRFDLHEFDGEQIVWQARDGDVKHPRTGDKVVPTLLDAAATRVDRDKDRLTALADWVSASDNPYFARAQANRIWFHLLGRGIVEPIDDFRLSNPPSNPALLDALTADFAANDFRLKPLLRTILQSHTYQMASRPTSTNEADAANFSRNHVRRLQAEQLLDGMAQVLEVPLTFAGYPEGTRATQLAAPVQPRRRNQTANTRPGVVDPREVEQFLRTFGKPDRLLTCECERSDEPTVMQAFRFMVGDPANSMISAKQNRLGRLLAANKAVPEVIEELYFAALSRPPSSTELEVLLPRIMEASDRRTALEDLAWGLLNAKEFLLRQ